VIVLNFVAAIKAGRIIAAEPGTKKRADLLRI
jgi:hypothetical protein